MDTMPMKRRRLVAALLGLAMPGLGQAYNGEMVKGACFFIILVMSQAVGFRLSVLLPGSGLLWGVAASALVFVLLWAASLADAVATASRIGNAFLPKSYNRYYFYVAAWLLGAVLAAAVMGYTQTRHLRFFKIPSASMSPQVLQGDYVVADLTAYNRMAPQKGDVIVFVYPDNRSQIYMKRIEALPGEKVEQPGAGSLAVPHGTVYVLADKRKGTVVSRVFGPVPLRDVLGKVRQVYFSKGPEGVRWSRIGMVIQGALAGRDFSGR